VEAVEVNNLSVQLFFRSSSVSLHDRSDSLFSSVRFFLLLCIETYFVFGMYNFIRDNQEERICKPFAPSHIVRRTPRLPVRVISLERREQKKEEKKKKKKKTLTRKVHLVGKERINLTSTRNEINRTLHHAVARLLRRGCSTDQFGAGRWIGNVR